MDERMDAPSGKRIVELLRKAARGGYEGSKNKVMDDLAQLIGCDGGMHFHTIGKLADMVEEAIQHEHESAYDEGYDEGFASSDDWCAQHEDAMAEHGWVRGPIGADGKLMAKEHMVVDNGGDVGVIVETSFYDSNWYVLVDFGEGKSARFVWFLPKNLTHYHVPTVEDVLQEFADEVQRCCDTDGTIAEYAAKLRLRGDGE